MNNYARVADSIIGWGTSVGQWSRIENKSVVGEDVHVKVLQIPATSSCLCACLMCLPLPSFLEPGIHGSKDTVSCFWVCRMRCS